MAIIHLSTKSKVPAKKKPGWQKAQAEHEAWLKSINSMSLFNPSSKPKMQKATKKFDPVVKEQYIDPKRIVKLAPSATALVGSTGKPVLRPELMYRDNPEMLERELLARQRKFNTAPAYNKGGDVLMTDEMMEQIVKTGGNRRRG